MRDKRVVLRGRSQDSKPESAINTLELTEEQRVLCAAYRIDPADFCRVISSAEARNIEEIKKSVRLIRLIDSILARHHHGIECKALFSYDGKTYRLLLQRKYNRGPVLVERFSRDLISDLIDEGRGEGLQILEAIIAGAVRRLEECLLN